MISAKNSLKVFVSTFTGPTNQPTLDLLNAGEVGFYDDAGALATSGAGYIYYKKPNGQVVKSRRFDNFPGWGGVQSYTAPVYGRKNIAVQTATAGVFYQATLTLHPHGMQGAYVKHGNYVAKTGDTTTDIATAIADSLTNSLKRDGDPVVAVSTTNQTIHFDGLAGSYKPGKKTFESTKFEVAMSAPFDDAVLGTIIVPEVPGIGFGPYVLDQELFAKGYSEAFRENGWPNSYGLDDLVAKADGEYDVLALDLAKQVDTGNGVPVTAHDQYLIAWDTGGAAPPAAP